MQPIYQTYANHQNDYSFFTVPHPLNGFYYGISCFRQLSSSLIKNEESTRAFLQKAVVILSTVPMFGLFYNKLELTTHAYFNQKDFVNHQILEDLYTNLISLEYINSLSDLSCGLPLKNVLLFFGRSVFSKADSDNNENDDLRKKNNTLFTTIKSSDDFNFVYASVISRCIMLSISFC